MSGQKRKEGRKEERAKRKEQKRKTGSDTRILKVLPFLPP
jgi:hypothetical protein